MCGDVGNSWACQIGLGASVQRDFLGLVAWWVEGDCACVFQALAAWPRICFCSHLLPLDAGSRREGDSGLLCNSCLCHVWLPQWLRANSLRTQWFSHLLCLERRQNGSQLHCLWEPALPQGFANLL